MLKSFNEAYPSKFANKSAKASLVGAKTVNGPLLLRVLTKFAVVPSSALVSAATRLLKTSVACAVSTMFFSVSAESSSSLLHEITKLSKRILRNTFFSFNSFFIIGVFKLIKCLMFCRKH